MASFPYIFVLFLHFHLTTAQGGELIFEDGYTVSTVLDGDKSTIKVNPHAIIHQSAPSDIFILLDSLASTFYTVSLPSNSNDTVMKRLAGNGEPGYADGDLASATFDKPRSFAVDFNGNVYVADYRNHAIRKITKSGVTTIAGGYTKKDGRADGPARDASFSNYFDLTFVPQRCALMISDHGNRLVRQINLRAADCTRHSGPVLGTTSAWLLGLGLSCLLSLIIGFVIRPYVLPYTGRHQTQTSSPQLDMETLPNESGETNNDTLLRYQKQSRTTCEKPVSLLDIDEVCTNSKNSSSSSISISPRVSEQLKDLFDFDGGLMLPANNNGIVDKEDERESCDVPSYDHKNIDGMIQANLFNLEEHVTGSFSPGSSHCSLNLVKRR